MPHLRLNMIVKNEAANLHRCLASVAPWVSSFAILDTGSTDGTPGIIKDFFKARKVPGKVGSAPFEDFGQARNAALDLARSVKGAYDYLLLCDADMELFVRDAERMKALDAPAYDVQQIASPLSYDNTRLVRKDVAARYVGLTHEYLDLGGHAPQRLEGVHFQDHCTGANRGNKAERDRVLLLRALEANPNDERAMFYLGWALKDLGQIREALEWFEKRADRGGFPEEAWYARYMAARCLAELGDARLESVALRAFEARTHRAEPLHLLAKHYRDAGRSELSVLFARAGAEIPYPKGDTLFVDDAIYRWGFKEELGISGYYLKNNPSVRRAAEQACYELSVARGPDWRVRSDAARNAVFYARSAAACWGPSTKIKSLQPSALSHQPSEEIGPSGDETWSPANPSIAVDPSGKLRCVVRLVNYVVGSYHARTGDGIIRTRNLLCELNENLDVTAYREMQDLTGDKIHPFGIVRGLEDLRLFSWEGALWASCTVLDRSIDGQRAEIALLELSPEGDVVKVHVQRGVEPHLHQKNWVPLVKAAGFRLQASAKRKTRAEELRFVYRAEPLTILRVDPKTRTAKEESRTVSPWNLEHLRGSSQAIPWKNSPSDMGWLYVAHEAHMFDEGRRYLHRLVVLDAELRAVQVSDPFYFVKHGIEFCAGLARVGEKLVMSFGVDDAKAYVLSVEEDAINSWLIGQELGPQGAFR